MDQFKLKHMTRYQRIKWKLKCEIKSPKRTWFRRLKIMWYKSLLERIRANQIIRGGK